MPKALKDTAVIFDLDGTLIDTADDLAASLNHVLIHNGFHSLAPDGVRHLVGRGARKMLEHGFEQMSGMAPAPAEMDDHLLQFLEHYEANIAVRSRPFPHALQAIETLRDAGAAIAICTNKRERLAKRLLEALSLQSLTSVVVGADTASAPKPDPAPVRLCLEKTGMARGVFVGDSDTDIAAAAAVSIPCLVATLGYGPFETATDAFALFDDYRVLPELVHRAVGK